jgi:hypothetical protein
LPFVAAACFLRPVDTSTALICVDFPPRPPLKPTKNSPASFTLSHAAGIAIVVVLAVAPAIGADLSTLESLRSLFPTHAGWTVLAGIGLVAVGLAAFSVRRPRVTRPQADDAPLGRMSVDAEPETREPARTEDAPDAVQASAAEVAAEAQPAAVASCENAFTSTTVVAPPPPEPGLLPQPPAVAAPHAAPAVPPNGSQLFLALHHVDLSIDVLRRHLQREPRPMPAVWLMLLDLCRTHGREQTFQELAIEFHRRFNVCTPAWEGFPPGRDDPGLEAYPRLIKEITLAWGTHECQRLLERLLYDNRGAQRKGFTLNAYNDLIALRRAADAVLDSIEKEAVPAVKDADAATLDAAIAAHASQQRPASSALVSDLESQLESDLRTDVTPQSAIEREHPALAGMLAREWGNAAMSARLCEMLARGGDSTHALSPEASEEIDLLRALAERLSAANGIALANLDAK